MDSGTGPADPATTGPMFALWCLKRVADQSQKSSIPKIFRASCVQSAT